MSATAYGGAGPRGVPRSTSWRGWPCPPNGRAVTCLPVQPAGPRSISRLAHGAYDLPGRSVERWLMDLAEVCACTPGAVIYLGTAAHFELLLPSPPCRPTLLLAGDGPSGRRSRSTARFHAPTHEDELTVGVVEDVVLGVAIRRTGPARTLVDLVRFCRCPADERAVAEAGRRFLGMGGDLDAVFCIADRLRTPSRARESLRSIGRAPARMTS